MIDKGRLERIDREIKRSDGVWWSYKTNDVIWLISKIEEQRGEIEILNDLEYALEETYRQEREHNERLGRENARLRKALIKIAFDDEVQFSEGCQEIANQALGDTKSGC